MIRGEFKAGLVKYPEQYVSKALVIDVGSASVRMMTAEKRNNRLYVLSSSGAVTRMGRYLKAHKVIPLKIVRETIDILQHFLSESVPSKRAVIATETLRSARNGNQVASEIEQAIGIPVEILSSFQEGELAWIGSRELLRKDDLLVDLGGKSTELVTYNKKTNAISVYSRKVGADMMVPGFDLSKKLHRNELRLISKYISGSLKSIPIMYRKKYTRLVVLGGTVVSVAMLAESIPRYKFGCVHGTKISLKTVRDVLLHLAQLSAVERETKMGIEPGRGELIIVGSILLTELMKWLDYVECIVSEQGIIIGKMKQILKLV